MPNYVRILVAAFSAFFSCGVPELAEAAAETELDASALQSRIVFDIPARATRTFWFKQSADFVIAVEQRSCRAGSLFTRHLVD